MNSGPNSRMADSFAAITTEGLPLETPAAMFHVEPTVRPVPGTAVAALAQGQGAGPRQ